MVSLEVREIPDTPSNLSEIPSNFPENPSKFPEIPEIHFQTEVSNLTKSPFYQQPILNGRDSVRKVLDLFLESGGPEADIARAYYGPVIENFSCEKAIYTAVEVTAGNRLFHHIVESDRVGTQILKEMNKLKLPGEVTFMPLNRLQVKPHDYPDNPDSIPMISKLRYEEIYDKALRYIFGKTLICRNLERATELAKSTGLDCVTLEGDQVSSKGCLTGGYFNTSRSRLEMQKKRTEFMDLIKGFEDELAKIRNDLRTTESGINGLVSDMQKIETKQGKSQDIFDKVQADIRLMKEELSRIERFRGPKERLIGQCKASLEAMNSTREGLENELHQELMSQLSAQDQQEVDTLNDEIRRLNQENKAAFTERMQLEVKKNKLDNLLTNNLFRRRDELVQALQEISVEDRKRKLTNCNTDRGEAEKRIDKVNKDLGIVDKKVQDATKSQKNLQKDLEKWSHKEKEAKEKIDEDSKKFEKWAAKENLLRSKMDECTEKIAGLGALPQVDPAYNRLSLKNVSYFGSFFHFSSLKLLILILNVLVLIFCLFLPPTALQRIGKGQPTPEEIQPRQQKSIGSISQFLRAKGEIIQT